MDWTKTTARRDEKHLCLGIGCALYKRIDGTSVTKWTDTQGQEVIPRHQTPQGQPITKLEYPDRPSSLGIQSRYKGVPKQRVRSKVLKEGDMVTLVLTHWGRDKMDAISQTTYSSAFSWIKMYEFRLNCHWSLFLRVQLTIFQHWFR